MIFVNFEKELREAFKAGQHSMLPRLVAAKGDATDDKFLASIPTTYEAWIERKAKHHKPIARL